MEGKTAKYKLGHFHNIWDVSKPHWNTTKEYITTSFFVSPFRDFTNLLLHRNTQNLHKFDCHNNAITYD